MRYLKTKLAQFKQLILSIVRVRFFYKKYKCPIKTNTMVKFDYEDMPKEYHKHYLDKFPKDEVFVFIGELQQMPAHCIVMNYKTGQIYSGYHTENFIPLTDEEV